MPSSHGNNTAPTITSAPPQAPRRMITGSKTNPSKISSSNSGPKLWHLFIGKLKKETTEDDLKEYLEDNGVTISEIRKLKPVNEFQAKSGAFRVSIDINCKDAVMNADLWPDNVQVCDWFLKPKNGS